MQDCFCVVYLLYSIFEFNGLKITYGDLLFREYSVNQTSYYLTILKNLT